MVCGALGVSMDPISNALFEKSKFHSAFLDYFQILCVVF